MDVVEAKDLRGGVVYSAAWVTPTTARTWAIEIGDRPASGSGHKRYSFRDVVALTLMRELTTENDVSAGRAAWIVNWLRPHLPEIIQEIVARGRRSGKVIWDGGPYVVVTGKPRHSNPGIVIVADTQALATVLSDRNSGPAPIVIPLPRIINQARMQMENVLRGDLPVEADD